MFVIVSLILLSLLLMAFEVLYGRKFKICASKIPGPRILPFIGNAHLFLGTSDEFLRVVTEMWNQYGNRIRAFVGKKLFVYITKPEDVEVVMSSVEFLDKSYDYNFLRPWLGDGLLTSTGQKWKNHRKLITPSFHFNILIHFIPIFEQQSDVLVARLASQADGRPVNIYPFITLCALDIISEAAMGVAINAQTHTESEYVKTVKVLCQILNGRMRNLFLRQDIFFNYLSQSGFEQRKALEKLHNFTEKVIAQRKEKLKRDCVSFESYAEGTTAEGTKKKVAFLDLLLLSSANGTKLSDLSIREEVDTFLFEGHDTTTSAMSFTLYLIAENQEVQEKIYNEQVELFGTNKKPSVGYGELQSMKYLELALKEAIRIYPPVPIIGREIIQDTHINDLFLPKGVTLLISILHMNRNPAIFKDPLKFVPERFLKEEIIKRNPYSTITFSAGPRNCIGQKFAMLEMKSTISKIIRNYKLLPAETESIQLSADIILKSINGIHVKLIKR